MKPAARPAPDPKPGTARTPPFFVWSALKNLRRARLLKGAHPDIAAKLWAAAVETLGDAEVALVDALSDEQLDALLRHLDGVEQQRAAVAKNDAVRRIRRWQVREVRRCMAAARGSKVTVQRRFAPQRTTERRRRTHHGGDTRRAASSSGGDSPSGLDGEIPGPPFAAAPSNLFPLNNPLRLVAIVVLLCAVGTALGYLVGAQAALVLPALGFAAVDERLAFKVQELAARSGLCVSTIFKLIQRGELRAIRYGERGLSVTREAWEEFVSRGEARPRPASRPRQKRPRNVGGAA